MRMHEWGSFGHMNSAATIEEARVQARTLEQRERSRAGNLKNARATLARRAGVSPATWRNLAHGRLKRLDAWLRDRLCALIIRELEAEIVRLEHDLAAARASGDHLGSQHVCEIETHLAKAREILGGNDGTQT